MDPESSKKLYLDPHTVNADPKNSSWIWYQVRIRNTDSDANRMRTQTTDTADSKCFNFFVLIRTGIVFQEHFDVVLIDDQTMDFPLAVLEEIEAKLSSDSKLSELQNGGVETGKL
jgi:hypothetical protein